MKMLINLFSPIWGVMVSSVLIPMFDLTSPAMVMLVATIGFFVPWALLYLPTITEEIEKEKAESNGK